MTRKLKYVADAIEIMKLEGKEINHAAVSSWAMTQFTNHTRHSGWASSIKQGDIALYFREFHGKATA